MFCVFTLSSDDDLWLDHVEVWIINLLSMIWLCYWIATV